MDFSFEWNPAFGEPIFAISAFTIGFIIYWFITISKKIEQQFVARYGREDYTRPWVHTQRLTGFLFLGVIPAISSLIIFGKSPMDYGFRPELSIAGLLWLGGISAILLPMVILNAGKTKNLEHYPMIRNKKWSKGLVFTSALTWFAYLVGYEFIFRGILLFTFAYFIGAVPAIALNVAFYSVSHIPKGLTETLGAIPFGVVVCYVTLETGTIWVAVFAHVLVAWTNEWVSLSKHPDMKIR